MMRGRVLVRLRDEVLDPQGTTVAQALANLGYDEVVSVRQGKVFEVELDTDDAAEAEAQLEEMAEELLANPVIESFQVSVGEDGDAAVAGQDPEGRAAGGADTGGATG